MGQRYPLTPDFDEYPRGILFYNTFLHCYVAAVVVADAASDLKTGQLIPEAAEKMNLCLSLADEKLKTERDNPSIGLILRRDNKNKTAAEYALNVNFSKNRSNSLSNFKNCSNFEHLSTS